MGCKAALSWTFLLLEPKETNITTKLLVTKKKKKRKDDLEILSAYISNKSIFHNTKLGICVLLPPHKAQSVLIDQFQRWEIPQFEFRTKNLIGLRPGLKKNV